MADDLTALWRSFELSNCEFENRDQSISNSPDLVGTTPLAFLSCHECGLEIGDGKLVDEDLVAVRKMRV